MTIYEVSRRFPKEETYSLTDQIRRSSRSVCANLAEAWRKRRYEAAFVSKLSDCESESAETQVWLQFASSPGLLVSPSPPLIHLRSALAAWSARWTLTDSAFGNLIPTSMESTEASGPAAW
jgi:four helix bundle protein